MANGDSKRWNVVFVLGPPGSGKGTQCKRISENLGFVHLSAGDLLRAERNRPDSTHGKLINEHIRNGTIVPVEITCKLLEIAMGAAAGAPPGFLIDGFPRNKDNLDGWNRAMGDKTNLQFVLFLECAEKICIERCVRRAERAEDNVETMQKRIRTYLSHELPIVEHYRTSDLVITVDASQDCPDKVCVARCLNRNEGRADDNEESLKKRIETYLGQTMPIIHHYDAMNHVRRVDAAQNPDKVYEECAKLFKAIMPS